MGELDSLEREIYFFDFVLKKGTAVCMGEYVENGVILINKRCKVDGWETSILAWTTGRLV